MLLPFFFFLVSIHWFSRNSFKFWAHTQHFDNRMAWRHRSLYNICRWNLCVLCVSFFGVFSFFLHIFGKYINFVIIFRLLHFLFGYRCTLAMVIARFVNWQRKFRHNLTKCKQNGLRCVWHLESFHLKGTIYHSHLHNNVENKRTTTPIAKINLN